MVTARVVKVSIENRYKLTLVHEDGSRTIVCKAPLIEIDAKTQQYENGAEFIKSLVENNGLRLEKKVTKVLITYLARKREYCTAPLYLNDYLLSENNNRTYIRIEEDIKRYCHSRKFLAEFTSPERGISGTNGIKKSARKLLELYDYATSEEYYGYLDYYLRRLRQNGYKEYRDWYLFIKGYEIKKGIREPLHEPHILYDPAKQPAMHTPDGKRQMVKQLTLFPIK